MSIRHSITIGTIAAFLVFVLAPFAAAQHGSRKQQSALAGVVLINQGTIASGLGCADQTPGSFPIVICTSGSYQLSSNLSVPAGLSGISIEANDVTLNLNGFTIAAAGANTTATQGVAGVMIPNAQTGITVQNGTVVGFEGVPAWGIYPNGQGTLRNLTVTGNANAISVQGSWVVTGCIVFNNQVGIQILGFGSGTTPVSTLIGNLVTGNQSFGVNFAAGLTGYGHNTFANNGGADILGPGAKVSMGDNVCGASRC